jgi:hypothetical protein
MSKTMKIILCFCLLMSAVIYVAAQQATPTPTVVNEDIIQMSRAGVLPAVIIAKIKNSQCKFDTPPSALVSLKQAGVADEVLMEMVRNPNGGFQLVSKSSPQERSVEASPNKAAASAPVGESAPMVKRDPSTFRNKSRFSTQYDKFKDETHVSVGPFFVGGNVWSGFQLEMSPHFFSKGHITGQPTVFYLAFRSSSKDWTFLHSRDLYAIVDGERLELGEGDHDSDIRLGGVREWLIYRLSPDVFYKMGTAHHVELKVGNLELTLKDEHLEAFRDLYSLGQP